MNSLLEKLINYQDVVDRDIQLALYEICDREHSSCNDACPVYEKNSGPVRPDKNPSGCRCFKDGKKMLDFLRE